MSNEAQYLKPQTPDPDSHCKSTRPLDPQQNLGGCLKRKSASYLLLVSYEKPTNQKYLICKCLMKMWREVKSAAPHSDPAGGAWALHFIEDADTKLAKAVTSRRVDAADLSVLPGQEERTDRRASNVCSIPIKNAGS